MRRGKEGMKEGCDKTKHDTGEERKREGKRKEGKRLKKKGRKEAKYGKVTAWNSKGKGKFRGKER